MSLTQRFGTAASVALTVTRDMRINVMLLVLTTVLAASTGFAQSVPMGWSQGGDGSRLGDCPGNCGGGCGNLPNICGGPEYWMFQPTGTPWVATSWWETTCPTGMYPWDVEISLEWAYGAFSYVGQVSDGCELHDTICRATGGLWDPICWITAPIGIVCNGAHAFTYGPYYDYNYGYFITKSVERRDLGRCFIPS